MDINTPADVQTLLKQIAQIDLNTEDITAITTGFLYNGFSALDMWKTLSKVVGFDKQDILIIIIASLQKGFGLKNFLTKVKDNTAKNKVSAIITKYKIRERGTDSDTPTLQRIVSTAGVASFACFKHVVSKNTLSLAVTPESVRLECPSIVCATFMNAIMGPVTKGSKWEPIAIINEYIQAQVTMKTMSAANRTKAGISTLQDAFLKNRKFADAARNTPLVTPSDVQDQVAAYINTSYPFHNTSTVTVSLKLVGDLCVIHKAVFTAHVRAEYIPLGEIGQIMKDTENSEELNAKLVASVFVKV